MTEYPQQGSTESPVPGLVPGAPRCYRCGAPNPDHFPAGAPPLHRACAGLQPDTLQGHWILLAYLVTVPFGCSFIGAMIASVPYYVWKSDYPLRAARYNRHVWIGFAISCVLYLSLSALAFRLLNAS